MSPQRDPSGPDHKPDIVHLEIIDGVVTGQSPFVRYETDNVLTEIYRPEWVGVFGDAEPIEHLYTVYAPTGGIRKEWYYHEHTLDRYMLLSGLLSIGLYDGRKESKTFGNFKVISLGASGSGLPDAIRIPPLVWHSLRWDSKEGMFINAKLPGYARTTPDKFRVAPDEYPKEIIWNI